MTRTRRLVLNALIIAGFLCNAFVFAAIGVDSRIPELSYAAVVASVIAAASFAAHLAAIRREGTSPSAAVAPSSANDTPKPNWRIASLWAWLTVSVVAALSDWLGGSSADERGLISMLGFVFLIAFFAWQALRVARMDQQLHTS